MRLLSKTFEPQASTRSYETRRPGRYAPEGAMGPGRGRQRMGFASASAIMLLGLVGIALVALATLFATHARRTTAVMHEAQQRELLLAAAAVARDCLQHNTALPAEITLPSTLSQSAVSLQEVATSNAQHRIIRIQACYGREILQQEVSFAQTATGWQLTEARLGRASQIPTSQPATIPAPPTILEQPHP